MVGVMKGCNFRAGKSGLNLNAFLESNNGVEISIKAGEIE
jgi:hypothetical protein